MVLVVSKIEFRIVPHHYLRDTMIVEVWAEGRMLAAIYPSDAREKLGITVISSHILGDSPLATVSGDTWMFRLFLE